jgi:hypothetical protein
MWGVFWLGLCAILAATIFWNADFWLGVPLWLLASWIVARIDAKEQEWLRQHRYDEYRRKHIEEHGYDPDDIADGPWEGGED